MYQLRRTAAHSVITLVTVIATMMALATGQASAATLFADDFEDGDTGGWSASGGTWSVVSDDTLALRQSTGGADARIYTGSVTWSSYTVQVRVKPITFAVDSHIGLLARVGSGTRFYRLALMVGNQIQLQAVNGVSVTVLASTTYTIDTLVWYTIALELNGTTVRGLIDGVPVVQGLSTHVGSGKVGLQTVFATASFDDVVVSQ